MHLLRCQQKWDSRFRVQRGEDGTRWCVVIEEPVGKLCRNGPFVQETVRDVHSDSVLPVEPEIEPAIDAIRILTRHLISPGPGHRKLEVWPHVDAPSVRKAIGKSRS